MATITFPTGSDISIEVNGQRLAVAQSYKARTAKESRYVEAFGSREPVGAVDGRVKHLLELTRVHNYGAAWSSFSGQRWLLVGLTSLILLAVLYVLARRIVRHPLGVLACCLIVSGGLGNILDRVRLGYVVDMFNFQFMNYPVFNVADICVVCGAALAAVYYLRFYEKCERKGGPHGDADAAAR